MSRVNYSNQDKEDSNFFMCVFQYLYANSGMTLNTLSKSTGISTNALTLMKNGQKVISFSAFDRLYETLTGSHFNFDESITEELNSLFIKMLKHHIWIEEGDMLTLIYSILNNRQRFENSFGLFLFHLVEMFHEFWLYNNDAPSHLIKQEEFWANNKIVQAGEMTLSPSAYCFYLDVCGLFAAQQRDMDLAFSYFEKALEAATNTEVEGMRENVQYHIARISYVNGRALEGYLTCQELTEFYARKFNPLRYCFIENVMIYLLTDLGEYQTAHEHACALLNASTTMKDDDVRIFVSTTLIWNAICAGWFQTALELMQQPDLKNKLDRHITGFEPMLYAKLNRIDEARTSLVQWKNRQKPRKIELLHAMVDDYVEERKRMFLRSNSAFIAYCRKYGFHMSERLARVLRLETTRRFGMRDEYMEALEEYLMWEHPKPESSSITYPNPRPLHFRQDF